MIYRLPGILGYLLRRRLPHKVENDPLDHDGDGVRGGSLPTRPALIAEADAIGATYEKRWNKQQIADAIEARKVHLIGKAEAGLPA